MTGIAVPCWEGQSEPLTVDTAPISGHQAGDAFDDLRAQLVLVGMAHTAATPDVRLCTLAMRLVGVIGSG